MAAKSHGSTSTSNDENLFLFIKDQAFHLIRRCEGFVEKEMGAKIERKQDMYLRDIDIRYIQNINFKPILWTRKIDHFCVINDLYLESGRGLMRIVA